MSPDPIDVVILSWNRVQMTLEAVTSVIEQEDILPCVWVLDQGSDSENARQLEESFRALPQVRFIQVGRNLGVADGRNRGIGCGSAPVAVCLDNDAVFRDRDALRHALTRFQEDDRLGALGFSILDSETGQVDRRSWVYPRAQLADRRSSFVTTRFCGAGHALRRDAFNQAGGYDPSLFFYWEEVDLSNRLIERGYRILYDPGVVVLHRKTGEGRYHWRDNRFYYLVRNALYLDWKYYRSLGRLALLASGYILKGMYNAVLMQGIRGIWDAIPRMKNLPRQAAHLGPAARDYIALHELRYRGNIWNRLRHEVLERLES